MLVSTKASAGVELVVDSGTPLKVNAHQARSDSVLALTACHMRTIKRGRYVLKSRTVLVCCVCLKLQVE